ncbi:hypothetical protein [Polaromonas hydrogenivorans]|uniref:Uncharacterized protein n=1 Tax=Polaromonas hydrogenivorans TaxID=335476 RepID=A0AAU7LPF5_9BURK
MTNVIPLASPRAAHPVQAFAPSHTFKPAPASPVRVAGTPAIERQQAIENALSMALYHVRHGNTLEAMRTATAKAIRAASMLKQACTESAISGRG